MASNILEGMNPERTLIAAEAIWLGKLALSRAIKYAKTLSCSTARSVRTGRSGELGRTRGCLADGDVGRLAI